MYHSRSRKCDTVRATMIPIRIGREKRDWHAGYGKFHCRICRGERSYTLIKSWNYFMLTFIPIFPLEKALEEVECHDCGRRFEIDALAYKPPPGPKDRLLERVIAEFAAGKSAEEIQERMVYPGLSSVDIGQSIRRALGDGIRTCERCRLHYSRSAHACLKCGDALLESDG